MRFFFFKLSNYRKQKKLKKLQNHGNILVINKLHVKIRLNLIYFFWKNNVTLFFIFNLKMWIKYAE